MIFDLSHPLDPKKRLGDAADWDSPYSWPVRREFSRILHRPRPHVGIVYTERFLNSRPLTYFDDETKIIRARAGALLKQVHAPLPKPSKILRPYETLDPYTSHQLIPYGVPQHVYHQSYFSEPAHLTIGRGHLACIQYAGGKGYPRRKHLYSDENRNIRDEIKFRSYYNRPKNEDPNSLPTGFAWRLLHLPPKDDKPFKIYKHSRTLPLTDSAKTDKEKVESKDAKDDVKAPSSYKKYQRNFTGPIEDVPKYEKRKTIVPTKEENYDKISDKYKRNEEEHSLSAAPNEEPQKELLRNEVLDVHLNEKDNYDKHITETTVNNEENHVPLRKTSKQALNRTKSLVSEKNNTSVVENSDNTDQKTSNQTESIKLADVEQEEAPTEPAIVKTEEEQKLESAPEPEKIVEEPDEAVIKTENIPETVELLHEKEVKNDEGIKENDPTIESQLSANEPDNVSSETKEFVEEKMAEPVTEAKIEIEPTIEETVTETTTEDKIIEPATEDSTEQKIPEELLRSEQESVCATENENALENTDCLEETPVQHETDEKKDQLDNKEEEINPISDIPANDSKAEESLPELQQEPPLDECSETLNNEDVIKTENTVQEEESNIIVDLNDSEEQNICNDSTVTITESHEESGISINQTHDEVTEISLSEKNETSETFYSREETVIQAFSSTQNSEALAESDKPETYIDMVNETDVTTDEENFESPTE